MRSEAATVPAGRRAGPAGIRADCRELLDGFTETMAYGMPGYRRDGEIEVGFASQKQYGAVYLLRTDVLDPRRDEFTGLDVGKGCLRYRREEQMDRALLRSLLAATAASHGPIC